MQTEDRKPYSRRDIVIIIIIILVAALFLGEINSTTTTVSSVSSGPISIAQYAHCQGFGEPTYYSSMDPELNYTTNAYGHCYFGFWFPNGQQVSTTTSDGTVL